MNTNTAVATIVKALGRATKGVYVAYNWSYQNSSGTEHVEYVLGKLANTVTYTKYSKFLFFKFGTERFTLSTADLQLTCSQWAEIGDAVHNTNIRLKAFK